VVGLGNCDSIAGLEGAFIPGSRPGASRRGGMVAPMPGDDPDATFTAMRIAAMDAGFGGHFVRARASLGATAFGLSVLELGPHFAGYPEHTHARDRQEEVYLVLDGAATIYIDDEPVELDRETLVRVGWRCRRRLIAGPDGVRFLVIGGRPGHPYEPSEFSQLGAPNDARRAGPEVAD
jgi:mannose-6-phosphate isomerase-like protein (cupin superfamily)